MEKVKGMAGLVRQSQKVALVVIYRRLRKAGFSTEEAASLAISIRIDSIPIEIPKRDIEQKRKPAELPAYVSGKRDISIEFENFFERKSRFSK